MSRFKFAIAFCVLLLLVLIPYASVSAQSQGAKSEESKFEIGGQFSVIGRRAGAVFDGGTGMGGGTRVTFNMTRYLALEGELNYFPGVGFEDLRRFQGQFGVKSGFRFDRIGVFGKVRPGFMTSKSRFTASTCRPMVIDAIPTVIDVIPFCRLISVSDKDTGFSMDVGGVVELYPARRITVRFDVGDTIVNRRSSVLFTSNGATHNLQLSSGIGVRF
jgi:hypothetical protein